MHGKGRDDLPQGHIHSYVWDGLRNLCFYLSANRLILMLTPFRLFADSHLH